MIAGLKPEASKEKLWQFLFAITPFMTHNDSHGVGYAAMGREGIWGERWLKPEDAWKYRKPWYKEDDLAKKNFQGTLEAEARFNSFGSGDPEHTSAITFHARMATCEKNIANTHPFVRGNVSLIHNGVINNTDELENITSTNDSECILNAYVKYDVANNPDHISKVADDIRGYYACGVLSIDASGKKHLDIFRNSTAQLSAYYVKELDAVVFCTRSDMIRDACKQLKWTYGNTFTFKDDVMVRIDCETGKAVSTHKFNPNYTYSTSYNKRGAWNKNAEGVWVQSSKEDALVPVVEKKTPDLTIVKGITQEVLEDTRAKAWHSTMKTSPYPSESGRTNGVVDLTHDEKLKDPFYYQADYAEYMQ